MESRKGIVTRIHKEGGFGYLVDQDSKEVWFHAAGVVNPEFDELKEGQVVNFYQVPCSKGTKAIGLNISDEAIKADKELLKSVEVAYKKDNDIRIRKLEAEETTGSYNDIPVISL